MSTPLKAGFVQSSFLRGRFAPNDHPEPSDQGKDYMYQCWDHYLGMPPEDGDFCGFRIFQGAPLVGRGEDKTPDTREQEISSVQIPTRYRYVGFCFVDI